MRAGFLPSPPIRSWALCSPGKCRAWCAGTRCRARPRRFPKRPAAAMRGRPPPRQPEKHTGFPARYIFCRPGNARRRSPPRSAFPGNTAPAGRRKGWRRTRRRSRWTASESPCCPLRPCGTRPAPFRSARSSWPGGGRARSGWSQKSDNLRYPKAPWLLRAGCCTFPGSEWMNKPVRISPPASRR